ncbi:MAG: hypothetical protein OXK80_06380 [Bdellovibrionales bacterium]|nr:hypothetical protein [Bdellovibrionales bacterium]
MNLKFLLVICCFPLKVLADDCLIWFENANISDGNCLIDCSISRTDMRTFHCPEKCDVLCELSIKNKFLFHLSDLYVELNIVERALVAKYPKKMLVAYQLTWSAENLCSTLFAKSGVNDASDACRHFVWSALLYQKFGSKFTQKVLNAHESEPRQPLEEKEMDLENNQLGLMVAKKLSEKNKLNRTTILQSFQQALQEGELNIINKTNKKTRR